jgi:hypothetical protein
MTSKAPSHRSKWAVFSKLNWLGVVMFVAGLAEIANQLPSAIAKLVLPASGVAVVVLRTFFTATRVTIRRKGKK